ncbi:MAG: glycosyltransferase family 2 protein, partial [Opitutus sp.]
KNEADIIEAFVRHNRTWVDEHLIFDHDSTDGTRPILLQLVREGLPLRLFTGDALGKLQLSRTHYLCRLAFNDHGADWVIPLDGDEFITADDRAGLERELGPGDSASPKRLPLLNYSPTTADNAAESNPVRRIQHRPSAPVSTFKVLIPRSLGIAPGIATGEGNHELCRGSEALPATTLKEASLAHFPLRSPEQQVLRVMTAELQKLSRGRAYEGLDTHYRLGFQLLAEDADLFFSTVLQPPERMRHEPLRYLGGELRYSHRASSFARAARALVPFLEKLARSHGRLTDRVTITSEEHAEIITPLTEASGILRGAGPNAFEGFQAISGWQPEEGPVPEAFLPRFHWATAPETVLSIHADQAQSVRLEAQALSYAENQVATVALNGVTVTSQQFSRVNQKENLSVPLELRAGENRVTIQHARWLESAADPRKLALIFLSLRIVRLTV